LNSWIDQMYWQRLKPKEKLVDALLRYLEGILNYCRTKAGLGWSKRSMATSKHCCGTDATITT